MIVKIETYREYDITFDTDDETFLALSDRFDHQTKAKKTFAQVRKEIDDYILIKMKFKPTLVECRADENPYGPRTRLLNGIRKDGRFTYLNEKGELTQFSEYDEAKWSVYNPENEVIIKELEDIASQIRSLLDKKRNLAKNFKPGESLADLKKDYIIS